MDSFSEKRIGWIGLGVMGLPMCGHLLGAGYRLTIFSRTPAKARSLLDQGALWAQSPRAVAESSDVVFTMVGFPDDVRAAILGEAGVLSGLKPGGILIDMTTTAPALSEEIFQVAKTRRIAVLDAPVSGGDIGAREARLSIMVGGERPVFENVLPLLEKLGKNIVFQGKPGAGQHAKLANQIVIASTMIGVCEALLYGYQSGLQLEEMLRAISKGAAACWTLENYVPRIFRRDFQPGFMVEHFLKDLEIALAEAARLQLALPGLQLARDLYAETQRLGHGRLGTQSLILALEARAGTEISARGKAS